MRLTVSSLELIETVGTGIDVDREGVAETGSDAAGVLGRGTCEGDLIVSGESVGADVAFVGSGDVTLNEEVVADGGGPVDADPVSRSTRFRGAVLPLKNSAAESAGSSEGAGGKMSAWKVSDWMVFH